MDARRDSPPAGPMLSVGFREALRVGVSAWAPSAGLSWLSPDAAVPMFTFSAFLLAPRLILEAVCHLLAASVLLARDEAGAGSACSPSLSPGLAASPPSSLSPPFTAEQLAWHGKREALGKVPCNQTCTSVDHVCGVSHDAQGPGCPVQGLRRWAGSYDGGSGSRTGGRTALTWGHSSRSAPIWKRAVPRVTDTDRRCCSKGAPSGATAGASSGAAGPGAAAGAAASGSEGCTCSAGGPGSAALLAGASVVGALVVFCVTAAAMLGAALDSLAIFCGTAMLIEREADGLFLMPVLGV